MKKVFSFANFTSRSYSRKMIRGIDILRDPRNNKDMSFSLKERQLLNINGLLPPSVKDIEQETLRSMVNLKKLDNDLNKHLYLSSIYDRNETLFYKMIVDNVEYCLPLVYTPTVGKVCQEFGQIFSRPRGLYITINDKENIKEILKNWPEEIVKAIVVTDGERILGLGDLGAQGMGIPIGKMSLYSALAGVPPKYNLPITLDVGTDNDDYLNDSVYIGIKQKRVRGEKYLEFIDAFMEGVVEVFGIETLVQFEDFANQNAFKLLNRYRDNYCTFNDDIQGTASVTLGALFGAENISKRSLSNNVFLFQGAGSAGSGIAMLLLKALQSTGLTKTEALSRIYMFDKDGLLTSDRPIETFSDENIIFSKDIPHISTLEEVVEIIKPTTIIGVAGVANVFTKRILESIAKNVDIPYVFALSNPTSKAECTAEEAYRYTNFQAIYACGSPFDKIHHENKTFTPSQCNNSYIFPGIALAITMFNIRPISDDIFIKAAEILAQQVSEEDISQGSIFPALKRIRDVSVKIAVGVAEHAYKHGLAHLFPEPEDKESFVRKNWFEPKYPATFPETEY